MRIASIAILIALCPLAAQAHDLWIERQEGTCTLLYGHRHSEHAGSDRVPYGTENLPRTEVRIRHAGGQRIAASLTLPATIPQCDEIVHSTVLTFDLEPK